MSVETREAFFDVLTKSRLLSPRELEVVRANRRRTAQEIALSLVYEGLLTPWQAEQLLAGKHKPFFIGKYKILEKLGQGGMGVVFKAMQRGIGRIVALKVLSKDVLNKPESVKRFHQEARTVAAVSHPNIVTAIDADQVEDTHFLVMDFVPGRDLKAWSQQYGKLPIDWSCECIRQAAIGLQHAYERGLVHRDIKPANLLVEAGEPGDLPRVKILDMGLAKFTTEAQSTHLTQTGKILGTVDYIAPEQARDTRSADIRADIFSLGCTLFKLVTNELPFPGSNAMERLVARGLSDAPPASTYCAEVPAELDAIISKMLARDPVDRFQTPQELVDALAPYSMLASTNRAGSFLDAPESSLTTGSTIDGDAEATVTGAIEGREDTALFEFLGDVADGDVQSWELDEPANNSDAEHIAGEPRRDIATWITELPTWPIVTAGSVIAAFLLVAMAILLPSSTEQTGIEEDFEGEQRIAFEFVGDRWDRKNGQLELDAPNKWAVALFPVEKIDTRYKAEIVARSHLEPRSRNMHIIFDYHGPKDFKYAGAWEGADLWAIGRYQGEATNGKDEAATSEPIVEEHAYRIELVVNGGQAKLLVDGVVRAVAQFTDPLNDGQVGFGGYGTHTSFDNVRLLPTATSQR